MARLPVPGADEGNWGAVLNDFLYESHNADGSLRTSAVAAAAPAPQTGIDDGSVITAKIADGAVTNVKLDSATQTAIATISAKYEKPVGGIATADLSAGVQDSLDAADSAVQSINGISPAAGNVTLTAANVGALTQVNADTRYTQSQDIRNIVQLSQSAYDNLTTVEPTTLYIII